MGNYFGEPERTSFDSSPTFDQFTQATNAIEEQLIRDIKMEQGCQLQELQQEATLLNEEENARLEELARLRDTMDILDVRHEIEALQSIIQEKKNSS